MSDTAEKPEVTIRERIQSLIQVVSFRPKFAAGIIVLSIVAALFEGIGLSFLIPVIEIIQGSSGTSDISGVGKAFVSAYELVGIPFTLEWILLGVIGIMTIRYTASFLVAWLRAALRTDYTRHLQTEGFENALSTQIQYYDERGSDEILNAIVTQSEYASSTIGRSVRIVEQAILCLMYLAISLYIAPWLTAGSGVILGVGVYVSRLAIGSGYSIGDRVAEANERIQTTVQAGTQGIRDVKIFGLGDEIFGQFDDAVREFKQQDVRLKRNKALIDNLYQMLTSITVFGLIYFAISVASLSLSSVGLFLFTIFRLAPRISTLNNSIYNLEGELPHMVRTQQFVSGLKDKQERDDGTKSPPESIERVSFESVDFGYGQEKVLEDVSFQVEQGEFIAFVGSSGAGKSTIVSLLARMYHPDSGKITAAGTPIREFVLSEWRERLSIVRQDPYIFNESIKYNITLNDRSVDGERIRRVCEIAQITEFLDDLPEGLDTTLGDDGVRLSGGQRQRVALARALLKDSELLILDEATSDLDSNIEATVHDAIENMDRDYAMIVIAHRLSTVVNADRIYTMEGGRIKERGSHDQLIDEGGQYTELYTTQTKESPKTQ